MNDLLSIVLDFNLESMQRIDFHKFIQDLSLFMGAYLLQSSLHSVRFYVAFPQDSYLMFPLEESEDFKYIKKFAYSDIKALLLERFNKVLNSPDFFQNKYSTVPNLLNKHSALSTALMQAVCYTRSWIDDINVKKGEQSQSRILIIKFQNEDPTQYTSLVNAIFAAQKLKIHIDSLIIKLASTQQPQQQQQHQQQQQPELEEATLVQQAAFLTNGTTFRITQQSQLFPILLQVFSSSPSAREKLKVPITEASESFIMSSTCVQCNRHISLGQACSFCLSLYCADKGQGDFKNCSEIIKNCIVCKKAFK